MTITIPGRGYEILVVTGAEPLDPEVDNVDVVVKFEDGRHHAAVFATLGSIRERLAYYKRSGECAAGLYFWSADLVIVELLSEDTIARTVENLIDSGTFESAFSAPSYDIQPPAR